MFCFTEQKRQMNILITLSYTRRDHRGDSEFQKNQFKIRDYHFIKCMLITLENN